MENPRSLPPNHAGRNSRSALLILSALWLLAVMAYAFAGMNLAPFHGDESEHLRSSRDFATYFLEGQPASLAVSPPYVIDSDARIRLLTGTLTDYLFGLGWYLAGYHATDLPGEWTWWIDYSTNAARGNLPSMPILIVGRSISTMLFALSIAVMFGLARRTGGLWLGFLSSGLYGLNPILLLNSRRAMTESALFFCGLLALFAVMTIVQRELNDHPVKWFHWAGMGACAGLAIAAKLTGIFYVAVVMIWVLGNMIARPRPGKAKRMLMGSAISGAICILVYLILTPSVWGNIPARVSDSISVQQAAIQGVAEGDPHGVTTPVERASRLITTPFMTRPEYFEAPLWVNYPETTRQVALYDRSWVYGFEPGPVAGAMLTFLMLAGLVSLFLPGSLRVVKQEITIGLLGWYAIMVINSLANPLAWARYDMQVIPISILLSGIGLWQIASLVRRAGHSESQ